MSKKKNNNEISIIFERAKIIYPEIRTIGKVLGEGAFAQVREIKMDNSNKTFAGKLIKKRKNKKTEEEKYGINIRGKNIININKIIAYKKDDIDYDLVIMEKASLRDIGLLNKHLYEKNLLKILYEPFDEIIGENLLRFYAKQIINALEMFDRNYYIHNDIKPQNLLITFELTLKLSDFGLLTKVKDKQTKIPEGTPGYLSPEFYINKEVDSEVARKQDYFALGSTLYFLKYGEQLLKYNDNNDRIMIADEMVDLLEQKRNNMKSEKMSDGEFINFICSLIQFKPENRPIFEEIYRNIWLNKNSEQINNIQSINPNDGKLIMELQKSDFLIKKEKEKDINSKNENRQKNKDSKNIKKVIFKKKKNNKLCRFRFKKRTNN